MGDYALVENLETTKRTAAEIEVKAAEAQKTEIEINLAREHYRPAAARASLLYFILNDLHKINPMYQFSLKVRLPLELYDSRPPREPNKYMSLPLWKLRARVRIPKLA